MDHGLPISSYRSHPLVLGIIGRPDEATAARFFDAAPGARLVTRADMLEMRAVGPVEARGTAGFHWGAALHTDGTPSTWQDVSEQLCAAGLSREVDYWVLFTDSLGVHSVYTRQLGDATFFSTRQAPLIALPGTLNVDWEAWASIFVMAAPLGAATPFSEIRRLEAASGVLIEHNGRHRPASFTPRWLTESQGKLDADDIVEAVRAALPPRSALTRLPAVPLSGGWDSRLLAALAHETYLGRLTAWTTDPDDGRDLDIGYAASVAETLGMAHQVVNNPNSGWPDLAAETRSRVEYETWLHPWFTPLCRRIRDVERDVLDGLGGDVLLKGLFVDDEVLDGGADARLERLFTRLGYKPERLVGSLRKTVADAAIDICRQAFFEIGNRFSGHLNQLALAVLHSRTARVVALSPMSLLAPEVTPWLPFLGPQVLAASLAVEPQRKTNGNLYRELLRSEAAAVAGLPSTNDFGQPPSDRSRQLIKGKEATTWMVGSILANDSTSAMLDPSFASEMQAGRGSWAQPDFRTTVFLQAASLLSQWERRYRHRLSNTTPPW